MSDQEKKQETSISPQPGAEKKKETSKKETSELSEEELGKASGGAKVELFLEGNKKF
jgi:hypothetical protein